jgi:hypothetical protein
MSTRALLVQNHGWIQFLMIKNFRFELFRSIIKYATKEKATARRTSGGP